MWEETAGLIQNSEDDRHVIIRTSVPCPDSKVEDLLEDLLDNRPGQTLELQIVQLVASFYADCLSGKMDAVKLLFGNDRGRSLLADFYVKSDLFSAVLDQWMMFYEQFASSWPKPKGPLHILEVGAGTGGTTWRL